MTTWWSKSVMYAAVAALVVLPVAALGSRFGLWAFTTGFLGLAVSLALALLAVVAGLIGLLVVTKRGLASERSPILVGMALGAVVLILMGRQFMAASGVPPIHNISTDTEDAPGIVVLVETRGSESNPWEYDKEALEQQQKEAYPDVGPLELNRSSAEVMAEVPVVLSDMGLDVVATHGELGLVEATATTFWFGFKDDVSVRVRDAGDGRSRVDVHSVSRVGQSDLGVNAQRIKEILARLEGS